MGFMCYVLVALFLLWLITREMKQECYFCHCNRKLKYLKSTLFGLACDDSCLYVAFITGKPVFKNGKMEIEYNWDRN